MHRLKNHCHIFRFSRFPKRLFANLNKDGDRTFRIIPKLYNSTVTLPSHLSKQNERVKVGPYLINYVKIGAGNHYVFCFPGILGCYRIQVPSQILHFDRNKFTFISWDQPGYGFSRPPERTFTDDSMEEDAEYLAEFMKTLECKKYSVMGWSGGGCTALLFAIKYPHLINKLVVWGTFSFVNHEDAEIYKWFSNPDNMSGKMMEILIEEYGEAFFKQHFSMWMELFQRIYTVRNGELCSKRLHQIAAPTLILHGKKDGLVLPRHGEYLRDHIPNSKLQIWDDGRHNLHLRFPERFNEVVQQFLLE